MESTQRLDLLLLGQRDGVQYRKNNPGRSDLLAGDMIRFGFAAMASRRVDQPSVPADDSEFPKAFGIGEPTQS